MSSFGSDAPFMLLAKLGVKEDKIPEYIEIAANTALDVYLEAHARLGTDLSVEFYGTVGK